MVLAVATLSAGGYQKTALTNCWSGKYRRSWEEASKEAMMKGLNRRTMKEQIYYVCHMQLQPIYRKADTTVIIN